MTVAVLVGTQKGAVILRSRPDGEWATSGLQLKGWLVTAFTRVASGRFYAGVTHDVWGTVVMASDDLDTWTQVEDAPRYRVGERGNAGHNRIISAMDPMERFSPGGRHVDQIWKLHAVGETLLAGVSEAGVFRSPDGGTTWEVLAGLNEHPDRESWGAGFGGLCAHSILVDADDPNRMWAGISAAGAFRSEDGGRTFLSVNDGVSADGEHFCVHALAHDPAAPDTIYRQDHRGVYRTDDGGDSWICIEDGLPKSVLGDEHRCTFGFPIAFDPASGSAWVIPLEGDSFRFPHDGNLAVYRTRDRGESWHEQRHGLPDDCFSSVLRGALALDHRDPCGVYFGTTGGSIYASPDGGESWRRLASDLPKILSLEAFVL